MRARRVAGRSGVALVLALWPVVGLAGPAHAESGAPQVVKTAWYWAEKTAVTPVTTLPTLPEQADAASGVPSGDLGVGYVADQVASRDKMAALDVDLTAIPLGSVFSTFELTVPVDSAGTNVGTPALSACENIDTFTEGLGPQDLTKAPPYAAPSCVPGVLKGTAYVFELTAIANEWSQGTPANGLSIVPTLLDVTSAKPFSVALKGKNDITVKAVWSPAPDVVTDPQLPQPQAPVPAVAPPPIITGGGGNVPVAPDVQAPQPQTLPQAPQPQVNPAPQAVAIRPAAYAPRSMVPSTQWWLAVLAVAALLGLAWITQNDPMVPATTDARRARFARAVRSA